MKLIVAACNSATSAALPALQERLSVPIVGVIAPEAHAAVAATRNCGASWRTAWWWLLFTRSSPPP